MQRQGGAEELPKGRKKESQPEWVESTRDSSGKGNK